MPEAYQIINQSASYFLTFRVCDWVDIFTRKCYCDILLESFTFCRKNKGLKLWAYVIMTNHVHLIASSTNGNLSEVIRDLKRHTASTILKTICEIDESRRDWMLYRFRQAAKKHKRCENFQIWSHKNHAIELFSDKFWRQKMAYIHDNPVRAGYVEDPDHWLYSSQRNYSNNNSLIEIDLVPF